MAKIIRIALWLTVCMLLTVSVKFFWCHEKADRSAIYLSEAEAQLARQQAKPDESAVGREGDSLKLCIRALERENARLKAENAGLNAEIARLKKFPSSR